MEGPVAAAGWDVSLHNFSARLWEQLVHFHVMRLTDSLFLWVGATPHLRNLAVAMCSRYEFYQRTRGEWLQMMCEISFLPLPQTPVCKTVGNRNHATWSWLTLD
nr:proteasome assembly chaperone 4 isoform X2 [Aotus nancymaae]